MYKLNEDDTVIIYDYSGRDNTRHIYRRTNSADILACCDAIRDAGGSPVTEVKEDYSMCPKCECLWMHCICPINNNGE